MNAARRSTKGWSLDNVLLDLGGGVLSIAQLLLSCVTLDEWSLITGNPIKLGLGLTSIGFDCVFVLQHLVYQGSPATTPARVDAAWYGELAMGYKACGVLHCPCPCPRCRCDCCTHLQCCAVLCRLVLEQNVTVLQADSQVLCVLPAPVVTYTACAVVAAAVAACAVMLWHAHNSLASFMRQRPITVVSPQPETINCSNCSLCYAALQQLLCPSMYGLAKLLVGSVPGCCWLTASAAELSRRLHQRQGTRLITAFQYQMKKL
jgi:hypothetical protein